MKKFFKEWRPYLLFGAFFSMFINLLQLTFPIYMLQIYDRVLSSNSAPTLYTITIAAIVALIIMGCLEFVRSRLLVRCGVAIDQALSRSVFDSIVKTSALPGSSQQQANLRDVNILRNFFAGNAIFAIFDIPWSPIFLATIYILHPVLGFVATSGAVVLFIFAIINEFSTRKPLNAANAVNGYSTKYVDAVTRNAHTVVSLGMVNGAASRWQKFNETITKLQTNASRKSGLIQAMSSWLRQSMQVFIYGVGAWLTLKGESTAGSMIAASIIMGRALVPIQQSIGAWKSMVEARAAWQRLDGLFSRPDLPEKMELPEPVGLLTAEHLSFSFKEKVILRDINFSLLPGESLGIIGPSGAGKSTLCRLLLGLWQPNSGKVRLDGNDLFQWDAEKIGPYLGYLPQDVELFTGTVAENIARLGAIDSEAVIEAAKKAFIHEMILSFANGYDTRIGGEGGIVLSGGQRQRLGLARALYGNVKMVILDEPNSNLDSDGELALVRSWSLLKKQGTTLLIVTHKPSLLASVDKILVLQSGQVMLFGPRDAVFQKLSELSKSRQEKAVENNRTVQ